MPRHDDHIPDTVGYTVPEEHYALFKMLRERVPNSDKAVFSGIATMTSAWLSQIRSRGARRRTADRMHRQRHRRARRKRLAEEVDGHEGA
jgi:hypothetical protein